MEEQYSRERVLYHNNGNLTQALIEGEVALPVGKPEMERILMVRGHAQTAQVELLDGRGMTDGTVTLCICYLCAEGKVHAFESVSTFKHTAELPGAQPGMRGMAEAFVCEVNYEMIDPRRINVAAVVDVRFETEEERDLCAMEENRVPENVVPLIKTLPLTKRCARGTAAVEVVGDIELPSGAPQAVQVLCCQGYVDILQAFCQQDAIGVEGELKLNIVVGTEDEQTPMIQCFPQLPFSQMITAPGALAEQDVTVRAQWKDLFARVNEQGDGLHIEAICTLEADTTETGEIKAVTDAYAIDGNEVLLEEQEMRVYTNRAKAKGTVPIREQVSVPLEQQPMRVLSCFANACAANATAMAEKVCLDTVVQCDVIFLDRSEQIQSARCEIPVHLEEEGSRYDSGNGSDGRDHLRTGAGHARRRRAGCAGDAGLESRRAKRAADVAGLQYGAGRAGRKAAGGDRDLFCRQRRGFMVCGKALSRAHGGYSLSGTGGKPAGAGRG